MNDDFGPFSVDPAQLARLGGALFQELMNRLLAAERAGLSGVGLRTSYQANVGDKGVDALIESSDETTWVPAGDSAWQFKAGDLGPKSCAAELAGATFAHEVLQNGGKYRLVLGKGLEPHLVKSRESELRKKAASLGFDPSGDNFKVIDGNQLAQWIETFPGLAVSPVLRGVGSVGIGFDRWSLGQDNSTTWVASAPRDELKAQVVSFLEQSDMLDRRIEGVSGVGKTRGVLEALRGSKYESLVLYIADADHLNSPLIDHLTVQKRAAVLVIDECTRRKHKVLAQQLEVGSSIRLITIGERDGDSTQSLPLQLSPLPDEVIEQILVQNRPSLWAEARRVVVANCTGNVRWALKLAEAILAKPRSNAGELLAADGMRELVLSMLAGDTDFLAYSALALFSRYGVDRDKQGELELIATGLDIPVKDLLDANRKLERLGLVTKNGRYRSVTPQPLAVFLSSLGWEELGDRILDALLPSLDASLAERLFLRAADIGSGNSAAVALNRILGPDGPFTSLTSMASDSGSRLLIQLAIICPDEVTAHLQGLIEEAALDELRELGSIRRTLTWSLEKLVWHSATFEVAANMLLRLALAENESFANNATGTWVALFSSMLPATAARPADRIAYLERVATDISIDVRKLAVSAADHALDIRGTVMVSGELQGGVVVEPRGAPTTYAELWSYVQGVIRILRERAIEDVDADVRDAASKALIDAIHPMLENEAVREELFDALLALPPAARERLWTEVNHLNALFDRVETPEFVAGTSAQYDTSRRRAGLRLLTEQLPVPEGTEDLRVLAAARRWEWADGELERKIVDAALSMPATEAAESMLELLAGSPPPEASYELGAALYAVAVGPTTLAALAGRVASGNIAGLVGYLYATVMDGQDDAFDSFLDGEVGKAIDPAARLTITVRGPKSPAGWDRMSQLMKSLPVHVGAPRLFGWHVDVEDERIAAVLADWLPRIETQQDYNFAVDVAAMMLFRRPTVSDEAESRIAELVKLRLKFGELGQQRWDWVQLARRRLATDPDTLLGDLLEQIEAGTLHAFEGSEEQKLLQEVIAAAGVPSLDRVFDMMRGSWRLEMDSRGWLANIYEPADVIAWIGEDGERARMVAAATGITDGLPSKLVRFLLDRFGEDDRVAASLDGNFTSGFWSGNESEQLNGQINHLSSWIAARDQPAGVTSWARKVIANLKKRREVVLEQEAEEGR